MRIRTLGMVALTGAATFTLAGSSDGPLQTSRVAGTSAGSGVQSVDLSLDPDRLDALFGAEDELAAARLMEEALVVAAEGDGPAELVLVGYRLVDGRPMATFESEPFQVAVGTPARVAEHGGLPAADFYGDAGRVSRDGIARAGPVPASTGVDDPVQVVTTGVSDRPADWYRREVLYLVAVPADEGLRAGVIATPVVLFGSEVVTLADGSAGAGATGGEPETTEQILERFILAEQKCRGWVQNYTLYRNVEGFVVPEYYEAFEGGPECRQVPVQEVAERWERQAGFEPGRWTHEQAEGLDMLGSALDQQLSSEGVPGIGGMAKAATGLMSEFVHAGADVDPDDLMVDDVRRRARERSDFAKRAKLVGTEDVDGRPANHFRAEGLEDVALVQDPGGPRFTLRTASLWIDREFYLPLRLLFEVTAIHEGKTRPLTIELLNQNYIVIGTGDVPPYAIAVPTRQVARIKGLTETMSKKDRAEIEQAVAEVKKLEAQLDQMPAAARGMIESQIARLKQMTGKDGQSITEAIIDVVDVVANEGPPYPGGIGHFIVEGTLFQGALVAATWYGPEENPLDVPDGLFRMMLVPQTISFTGRTPDGRVGLLEISDLEYGDFVQGRSNSVSGRLDRADGTTISSFDGESLTINITALTPTLVEGTAAGNRGAWFRVGHQPCSNAPRVLSTMSAEDADIERWRDFISQDGYEHPEFRDDFLKSCVKNIREARRQERLEDYRRRLGN